MPKVIVVSKRDLDVVTEGPFADAIPVSDLAVGHAKTRPVLYLTVQSQQTTFGDAPRFVFALSPPAAKQLSDLLGEAVVNYLHASPDDDKAVDNSLLADRIGHYSGLATFSRQSVSGKLLTRPSKSIGRRLPIHLSGLTFTR